MNGEQPAWWKRAVFYEIFVPSYQDSDGDGFGDLPGITARLDHLQRLGIGAVWLSPIYPSPMLDGGYDVADFTSIDARFGTLDDFDRLLAGLHARDIRLILDFVPNHTSSEHPWFRESRAARTSPRRDWYIWADPRRDGGPPNNWLSRFGGSAWEWDGATGQYYLHDFLKEQPDLNWRNSRVRAEIADALRFWLRRGVDGFRLDASAVFAKDDLLRDDPDNPDYDEGTPPPEKFKRVFTDDRPDTHAWHAELRAVIDEFPDRVLAAEVQGSTDRIGKFYPHIQLPLNYCLIDGPWQVRTLQAAIDKYLNALPSGAWPDWMMSGHDKKRIAGRVGPEQARTAAMLLLTLPGTPFMYAGDEIGLPGFPVPHDRIKDPFELLVPATACAAIPSARPCAGTADRTAASRRASRGFRSAARSTS